MTTTLRIFFVLVLCVIAIVSRMVWIPDVIRGTEITVGHVSLNSSTYVNITQQWNGLDGYWLRVYFYADDGNQYWTIVDGDSFKIWGFKYSLRANNTIIFFKENNVIFSLDISNKLLTKNDGVKISLSLKEKM